MALGSIFGRFWIQVGRQVQAKLEPKSTKMALQKDVQNNYKKVTQVDAVLGVGGLLKKNCTDQDQAQDQDLWGQGQVPGAV